MEKLIILSQIFQACVPNRCGMPWPGVVQAWLICICQGGPAITITLILPPSFLHQGNILRWCAPWWMELPSQLARSLCLCTTLTCNHFDLRPFWLATKCFDLQPFWLATTWTCNRLDLQPLAKSEQVARATVDKIFQLTAGCQVAGSYLQLRAWPPDRARRPNKPMEFRFFDSSPPDCVFSVFQRTKDDRKSSVEFFALGVVWPVLVSSRFVLFVSTSGLREA